MDQNQQASDLGNLQTFEQFLLTQNVQISVVNFLINLLLTALLAFVLSKLYVRYGDSLSNRKAFGGNFVLIAATTMIIITIVKSSLALSLGLVGALSIVRFRAAIKEPEELAYIFLTIAIGLGMGADQRVITLAGFALVVLFIIAKNYNREKSGHENLLLTLSTTETQDLSLNKIVEVLKEYCTAIDLKRFDESENLTEISFLVEYNDFNKFHQSKAALKNLNGSMSISFIDNKGMI